MIDPERIGGIVGEALLAGALGALGAMARFSSTDRRLLEDLTHQVATAVHAARLAEEAVKLSTDLQRSRERLVSTRGTVSVSRHIIISNVCSPAPTTSCGLSIRPPCRYFLPDLRRRRITFLSRLIMPSRSGSMSNCWSHQHCIMRPSSVIKSVARSPAASEYAVRYARLSAQGLNQKCAQH